MSEDRDLYEILGVSETATRDDLTKAYRRLARKYHPDVNKSPDAKTKMQEVSAAYDVLSDDSKRREYDEQRKYGAAGSQRPSYPGGSWTGSTGDGYMGYSSPFSSFYAGGGRFDSSNPDVDYGVFNESPRMDYREFAQSNPFSAFSMGSMFGEMPRETGEDSPGALHAALTIDFKTAVEGADEISMSVGSNGRIVKAKLPAGLRDGQTIRLKGRGARVDGAGRKRGDLFIKISVEPDPSGVWSMSPPEDSSRHSERSSARQSSRSHGLDWQACALEIASRGEGRHQAESPGTRTKWLDCCLRGQYTAA